MPVPVREFRAHLSQYLKAVQRGESVVVTVRNQPVATLSPIPRAHGEDLLTKLERARGIQWGGGKPRGSRVCLQGQGVTASEVVQEGRG